MAPTSCYPKWIHVGAILLAMIAHSTAGAEWSGDNSDQGQSVPVYQRRAFEWDGQHGGRHDRRFDRGRQWTSPEVNAGWFQRPYPYHLDYYKMRYGGSYAPYFGNLYGPPQVVTAPPYYGPYYNGYEFANPGDGAFNSPYPSQGPFNAVLESPVDQTTPAIGDELPTP